MRRKTQMSNALALGLIGIVAIFVIAWLYTQFFS